MHYCGMILSNYNPTTAGYPPPMITQTGNAVLTEYLSEVHEKIDDDTLRIHVWQGLTLLHSLWRIALLYISGFFTTCLVIGVVILAMMDHSMLDALRQASNDEILSGIRSMFIFVSGSTFLLVLIAIGLKGSSYFRDIRQERIANDQYQARLIKTMIEINEELLVRHRLIKAETANHD
jgi:hypothetical protein